MDGLVEYADGTESTVDQMAKDVTTFLAWAAEPELKERHKIGVNNHLFNSIDNISLLEQEKNMVKD